MSYTMIKNCKMDWGSEKHRFTFVTGGSRLEALDSLGDLIGSLEDLYKHISNGGMHGATNHRDIPHEYKIEGGMSYTRIKSTEGQLEL
jgi:hypothetical protein